MSKHTVEDIRNVALVGHGAVGKTTLGDYLLFKAGLAKRPGSPDDGSSLLDIDDEEKDRKSSTMSAVCHISHAHRHINLIDTPGYPDFIGQAIGALRAVETAIVTVSAPAGIEVNTRRTFRKAGEEGCARAIVITKLDCDNVDFENLMFMIQETFGPQCIPFNLPIGMSYEFRDVVSTLNAPDSMDGVVGSLAETNAQLMDAIVEADENLMERFLEGEDLSPREVAAGVTKAMSAGTLIPVFCVSAKTGAGVPEFMDAIACYFPSPVDIPQRDANGDSIEASADSPLTGQVFKTRIDPFVAKLSFIRVFAGTLQKDATLFHTNGDKPLKTGQLLSVQGGRQNPVDAAGPGDIVAIAKLDALQTGETITGSADGFQLPLIPFPKPMVGLAVEPKTRADQSKISAALNRISEEDQTFHVDRDPQTKELVMRGVSELHLQIAQERLLKRDKVEVVTHQPKVPYRETVVGSAEGSYRHKKQSGGSGQFAEVHFRISSCPQGIEPDEFFVKSNFDSLRAFHYDPATNSCFIDRVTGGSVPNNFIPAVEKGVRERMQQGVMANYQVQDVVCELFFGKDHPVDSNETAFKTAASHCFREVFQQAKPALLEPIVNIEITIPDSNLGDITSDLNTRRGRVEGMDGLPGGFQAIHAKVPLAEVMTYARSLSSMTGGRGSFTMELSHYEMVPPNEQAKIIAAAQKDQVEEKMASV